MKKFLALVLASLMLLASCGTAVDTTSATDDPNVTDAPTVTDEPSDTDAPVGDENQGTTAPDVTTPAETEPPVPVERFDHVIEVKDGSYRTGD